MIMAYNFLARLILFQQLLEASFPFSFILAINQLPKHIYLKLFFYSCCLTNKITTELLRDMVLIIKISKASDTEMRDKLIVVGDIKVCRDNELLKDTDAAVRTALAQPFCLRSS